MDLVTQRGWAQVTGVDVRTAKYLLDGGVHRYLDVRNEEEFKNGHVENALNVPYMLNTPEGEVKNPKYIDQVLTVFSKEDQLIVGSQDEVGTEHASADLRHAEFQYVYSMIGGYNAWVGSGFPIKNPLL